MLKTVKARRSVAKPHVKKDDTVIILSGEDAGKKGRVLEVRPEKGQVFVEGVNYVKRHQRPTKKIGKGGIIQKEGAIFLSRVGLLCGACNKVTRAKIVDQQGELARVCKLCNEPLGRK
ncbi:MAG: LSU ribosomal protein L24p (L26e) [Candidatus Ozemobacter sibiricus]|jgi:large subunit ribosomal protein L24|uniref:Large ribosomal subunit protein uL24 n=1 Tax=Candidatus Ozemobacter sibiricus TaxID=2268124 RepID=A0A367ZL40_9BACT|nr:MAG: LSU ribosomal protein L24p (L26e) [Candidatus Ozemobacter sibiricus]